MKQKNAEQKIACKELEEINTNQSARTESAKIVTVSYAVKKRDQ